MVQIKHFTAPQKNAKFSVFKTCKMAVAGQNTRRPPARPENYCESKQTYFSYSLNKAFHSPECQAKLFFTRNWVGGFYWDSLLNFYLNFIAEYNILHSKNVFTLVFYFSNATLLFDLARRIFSTRFIKLHLPGHISNSTLKIFNTISEFSLTLQWSLIKTICGRCWQAKHDS